MAAAAKKITLRSSDGEVFEVDEAVAEQSQTIKHMMEDDCAADVIPIHNVTSNILAHILEYCKKQAEPNPGDDLLDKYKNLELKNWEAEFIDKFDLETIIQIILAANYLDIKKLMASSCQYIGNMMTDKTPEQIRKIFNIKNDYTPEEEEEVRRENKWAFDD